MEMKTRNAAAAFALLVSGLMAGSPAPARAAAGVEMAIPADNRRIALRESMRKLWADHVIWTRAYVVAAVAGSPDAADVAARLLKNQAEIGEAFAPYYGKEAGAKLAGLLKQHILLAADVVDGAKTGDAEKYRTADARWHQNAADIAAFLNSLNPNWPEKDTVAMFNEHLALTTKEAVSRLDKKWPDDIAAFDEIFRQMMLMADDLFSGIVNQFPEKF